MSVPTRNTPSPGNCSPVSARAPGASVIAAIAIPATSPADARNASVRAIFSSLSCRLPALQDGSLCPDVLKRQRPCRQSRCNCTSSMDSGGQPSSPQRLLDRAGSRSAEQQRAHQASAVQSDIPRSIGSRHAYRSAATWWRSSDVDHRQVPMTVLGSAHRQLECAGTPENELGGVDTLAAGDRASQ